MKRLFLTFDYEIFFAASGTVGRSLLQPTRALSTLLKPPHISATFFVDTVYLQRLAEKDPQAAQLVRKQLYNLVSDGHRLELHLHPHWLDAEYHSGVWQFPNYRHYRLQTLESGKIRELFISGKELLEAIARESSPGYRVQAFRAGGWCIQPFATLQPAFEETGLTIDSSIGAGMHGASPTHRFDFTMAPRKAVYRFGNDPTQETPGGPFMEVPVSTYECPPHWRLRERLLRGGRDCRSLGDGHGLRTDSALGQWRQLLGAARTRRRFLSLDGCQGYSALKVLRGDRDAVLVSHPKLLTPHSLMCLERLLAAGSYRFSALVPSEFD